MREYDATELAYKNGFEAGLKSAVRHGAWITYVIDYYDEGRREIEYKCSECGRFEPLRELYCHCGAKMDLVDE